MHRYVGKRVSGGQRVVMGAVTVGDLRGARLGKDGGLEKREGGSEVRGL